MDYWLLRTLAIKELDYAWDNVLFDGEEMVNSCAVPQDLCDCLLEQVAIHIYPYYIEYKRKFYPERTIFISPKVDYLCSKI